MGDIFALEAQLGDDTRETTLMTLRERLTSLSRRAAGETDTRDRAQARRVLRLVTAGAAERTPDPSTSSCSNSSASRAADQRPAGRT